MFRPLVVPSFVVLSILSTALPAQKLELPSLFQDHMVLQRDMPVPVWGWAVPSSEVTVTLGSHKVAARVDADGRFMAKLPKLPAGGPHELVVEGGEKITVRDVLIGEVWIGSGQSNMAWTVQRSRDFDQEKAAAKLPKIRMFTVKRASKREPQAKCAGDWKVCTPDNVGAFSATAYFFGRQLHEKLSVPVGLINTSWGGTAIEAWTSAVAQNSVSALAPVAAPWKKQRASWSADAAKKKHAVQLAKWKERAAKAKAANKRVPRRPRLQRDPALNQNHPANLFNGMIAPLVPYAMRGAVWYQGERNARTLATAKLYRVQMPVMISDWRARWGRSFPFGIVQLPNFKKRVDDPGTHTAWALIRESMLKTLSVENTGLAITIDVGEAKNIHPKDKQTVGYRLAQWALADVYGKDVVGSGPLLENSRVDGASVVLTFRHAVGLKTRDGEPVKGFAIAGADRKWRWAEARIDGDRVIVSHPDVAKPAAVRYAWGDNPDCNLVNAAGLPASPFRTDAW